MKIRNSGDWVIASLVILCSIVLFAALAMALTGTFLGTPGQIVYADFEDVSGLDVNSDVKFAGATAGVITGVRILTSSERMQLENPENSIRVTIALRSNVPPPPSDVVASVAADTLLSEKFLLLSAGSASAPPLSPDSVIASITPTTFDQLVRNTDTAIAGISRLMGGAGGHAGNIFLEVRAMLNETQSLLTEVRPILATLNATALEAKSLVSENRAPINRAITGLEKTSTSLEQTSRSFESLANQGTEMLKSTDKNLSATLGDLKVTSQNAKIATTFARILALRLAQNPSQLVWGTKTPPPLPTDREILLSPKPIPLSE
ncbi:MAG: MlaD family protein [Terrimicrobiaceae bacterium]